MFIVLMFFMINIFLNINGNVAVAKTWRYYPVSGSTHGYFTTKSKFILEYIGSVDWVNMKWYYHNDCQVENKTLPRSIAHCFKAGYYPFGILDQLLNPLEIQSILVVETPYCYEWQMALLSANTSSSEFNLKFQLWISKIGDGNDGKNSSFRNEFSREISKIFYDIGQRPLVSATFSHSNDEITIIHQESYFAENNSVWEVTVMVRNLNLLKLNIDGPPTAFMDCFIKPMVFEYQYDKFNFAAFGEIEVNPLGEEKSELKIVQDDCAPGIIAVVSDGHLILTQDYFVTNLQLNILQYLVENGSVHEAVFTHEGGFIIHTGVKTLLVVSNSSEIYAVQGLPNEKLQFSSNSWCHQEEGLYKTFNDLVIAWNNKSSMYVSFNPAGGFVPLSLPNFVEIQDFKLLDAKVNGMCHCVYFLMELSNSSEYNNSKVIGYTTQECATNKWGNFTKVLDEIQYSQNNSNWSFQFLPPHSFSMLIWNSWDVFYKSAEEQQAKAIIKKSILSSDSNHKRIIQVAASNNGEYLVLYESNILYYGRIGMDYIVQLLSRFPEGPDMRMIFDLNGYARVVSVNKSNSLLVSTTHFPLDNEIFNAVYPTFSCPFIEFLFGRPSSTNVFDKWEKFEIWGYLVYKRSESNDIQLKWNPSSILRLAVSEKKEYYNDVIMLNKTFTFTERSPENSSGSFPKSFSVTLLPKLNGMICKRPFYKVFHFHVGCPSSRRAILRDARSIQSQLIDEHVSFSLKLVSGDVFRPVVFLYDDNVLIERVHSSFVVLEVNGREDFSFTDGQELVNAVEPSSLFLRGNGMFMFSLSFDDRNTSFCSSTLEFSVLVEEKEKTDYFYIMFACVTLITILLLTILGINYVFYRKTFLQRHEEDDDRRDRLQELQYLAQLQYFRVNSSAVQEIPAPVVVLPEDVHRRAALVFGKSERRSHRRSSVFERVSRSVFDDLQVQRRSLSVPQDTEATQHDESTGDVH